MRYQIYEEDDTEQDTKHFEALRKLEFFTEFENIELWKSSASPSGGRWRRGVAIIREGETNQLSVSSSGVSSRFRSTGGRCAAWGRRGDRRDGLPSSRQQETPRHGGHPRAVLFLEISASALALSSEELVERMRNALTARMIDRLRKVNEIAAAQGAPAVDVGTGSLTGMTRSAPGSGSISNSPM